MIALLKIHFNACYLILKFDTTFSFGIGLKR